MAKGFDSARVGYHYRDALRLLFILVVGSEPDPTSPRRVFHGEKREMAIDFFVRYPDYLAAALLAEYESTSDEALLTAARSIFDNDEPDIRRVAMIRWRRGAFENIETALAILESRQLVRAVKSKIGEGRFRHDFFIEPTAERFLTDALSAVPELAWYRDRAALAMRVARYRSGSDLKDEQYEHEEYRNAAYGHVIPSIKDRVQRRIAELLRKTA